MTIQQKQAAVVADLNSQLDWPAKITRIIAYGADLPTYPTDAAYNAERFVVRAADCSTRTYFLVGRSGQNQYIRAKSNATISLGLAGILHYIYNGQPLNDVASFTPTFITSCGLDTHLTLGQLNLLNAMLGQINDFIHDVPMADEPTPQEEINRLAIVALQTRATTDEGLISANAAAITTEATNRQNADTTLQTNITTEATTRQTNDSTLQVNIDAEESARQTADTTLQANITTEATTRQNADTALQTSITNEATARQTADTTLQTNITNEATARATAVSNEATARQNADATLQNSLNQIATKVNGFIPETLGEPNQVLTVGPNNTIVWKNPPTAGLEIVTVTLTTQDGQGSVSGVLISVQVEGENTSRTLYTNSNGICVFKVGQGLNYTITFGEISGYRAIDNITYRASLNARAVNVMYRIDESVSKEHVIVDLTYSGTGAARATTLNVVVDNITSSYPFVGNRCEFNVDIGKSYRIEFTSVTGYVKPLALNFTASISIRALRANYIGAVAGLAWVKNDGTQIDYTEVTAEDLDSLVGLYMSNQSLINARATYIIPIAYLFGDTTIGAKQWCTQNIQFESIGNYTSASAATTDDGTNLSGESNTAVVLNEATTRSLSCPAFTACNAISLTINGVTKNCFLGSYAQMKLFADNRENINLVCQSIFNKTCIRVSSGLWWTSTQSSQTGAVTLNYGGFYSGSKTLSASVVPFLAY